MYFKKLPNLVTLPGIEITLLKVERNSNSIFIFSKNLNSGALPTESVERRIFKWTKYRPLFRYFQATLHNKH